MHAIWKRLDASTRAAERAALTVAVGCALALMLVSVADAAMRYALNSPLAWWFPVVGNYVLVALFFLAVSETQRRRHHISIDFVTRGLSARKRALAGAVSSICIAIFAILILAPAAEDMATSYVRGDLIPGIISWPRWPTFAIVVIGLAVLLMRAMADALGAALMLAGRLPPDATADMEHGS